MTTIKQAVQEAKRLIYKRRPRHLEEYDKFQNPFIRRHLFKHIMNLAYSRDTLPGRILRQAVWTSGFIHFLYNESDMTFYDNIPGYRLLRESLRTFPATHLSISMDYSATNKTLTTNVYFLVLNVVNGASAA